MNLGKETKFLLGVVAVSMLPSLGFGEVVFEETFDSQPDWTSTMHSTEPSQVAEQGYTIPDGWYGIYQGTRWSPEMGFPNHHASLEILDSNEEKTRGGTGKSAVFWRESYDLGWNNWSSDAQFAKVLDEEHQELYVEFYIRFSQNWWQRDPNNTGPWASKLFRVGSWSGTGRIWNGAGGEVGPRAFWDYKRDDYGVRNVLGFFKGPHGQTGSLSEAPGSVNYTNHTEGEGINGTDPELVDRVNGGFLVNFGGPTTHDQVFGPTEKWTKVAFYVRMNSAPGVADGIFRQWIDDEQIRYIDDIPWVVSTPENNMVGWNYFAIGGNDYFQAVSNENRFEDWYAIDDLVVRTDLPSQENISAPNPPSVISVE